MYKRQLWYLWYMIRAAARVRMMRTVIGVAMAMAIIFIILTESCCWSLAIILGATGWGGRGCEHGV